MITKVKVVGFKKLEGEFELSQTSVLVGPNNSGKTSALQAIILWQTGLVKWAEIRKNFSAKKRTGVAINRKDLLAIPIPSAKQLWKDLNVREVSRESGKQVTNNITIEVYVEGFLNGAPWQLGFEFDYVNAESFYCRPILPEGHAMETAVKAALSEKIGFLPPMSGLAVEEDKLEMGSINFRIGEGRTAEVLRNLCLHVLTESPEKWKSLCVKISRLFDVQVNNPEYDGATGKISMTYIERGKEMDLSNGGRGFHQILLILAYIYANKNTVILLDEPDAHLEILRQRQVYNVLSDVLKEENSQLIVATHSEVILAEAIQRDKIIAFIGKPHVILGKEQILKSLNYIGFDEYILAAERGWVLYLEGATDLEILRKFAELLEHPVSKHLEAPFVKYVQNHYGESRKHFFGLREATPTLKGVALYDQLPGVALTDAILKEMMWERCEIENYLPLPEILYRYAEQPAETLFTQHDLGLMEKLVAGEIPPAALADKSHAWWTKTKMSDDFLDKVIGHYFVDRKMPVMLSKGGYHTLVQFAKKDEIAKEVVEKLDAIYAIASSVSVEE